MTTADSDYNAGELRAAGARDVRVVPVLFESARLGPAAVRRRAKGHS